MELLVVIAIIAVLAAILLPSLQHGKARAKGVACISNLKQLQLCWELYADDHDGRVPPNNSVVAIPTSGAALATSASWCAGSPRHDLTPTNIQRGLLYPYNRSPAIYHCPAAESTVEDAQGKLLPQPRTRSYNMSQSINSFPDYDHVMRDYIPSFRKVTQIRNPNPESCLVFIDEHADTMYDALFGMPTDHYDGSRTWWDLPANRHNQGANLSFADGHVERWRWKVPKTFRMWVQSVPDEEMPDWLRVKATIKQRMN